MDSSLLKHQAQHFLNNMLHPLIEPICGYTVIGSMDLDLMVWPDIDIQLHIEGSTRQASFLQLCERLFESEHVKSIKIINFYNRPQSPFAKGYCMCVRFNTFNGLNWKVDLWSQSPKDSKEAIERHERFKNALNQANKALILKWKNTLLKEDGSMPKHASLAIYTAVLVKHLKTDKQIRAYLLDHPLLSI